MKLQFWLAASLLLSGATEAKVVSCEGCTPDQMFKDGEKVVRKTAYRDPHPPVYVTNIRDNAVIKLIYQTNVDGSFSWELDQFISYAEPVAVEPSVRKLVSDMNALQPPTEVRLMAASLPWSAYDVIRSSSYDASISEVLVNSRAGFTQGFYSVMRAFNPVSGFSPSEIIVTARVIFQDASSVLYRFDATTKMWVRIPGSARDSDGNSIPENAAQVAEGGVRQYNFQSSTSESFTRFVGRVNELHFDVLPGPTVGGSAKALITCTPQSCKITFLKTQ